MDDIKNRIERITRMERYYDAARAAMEELMAALDKYEAVVPLIDELECYYSSPLWRQDYEADERGELPPDLKRGVLSQDGLYDLLDEHMNLTQGE